ncbi:uncharacterized protein LOC134811306 [Bolinopsis microptera]|uniref:uncharacterized protein LOC134811306 n=1 Tax=Bolinopsis microptera TaxID=2820187 RepID=UPI00307A7620
MDNFADSVFGTLKKIKTSFGIPDSDGEDEEKKVKTDGAEEKEHHTHRHKTPAGRGKRHSRENVLNPSSANEAPKKKNITYETDSQGKDGTLLAIARHKPDGPNSETGKRTRSMRLANSMNSVYRKLRNDKNIHNDRHYLVAVTEHLKEDAPDNSGQK